MVIPNLILLCKNRCEYSILHARFETQGELTRLQTGSSTRENLVYNCASLERRYAYTKLSQPSVTGLKNVHHLREEDLVEGRANETRKVGWYP